MSANAWSLRRATRFVAVVASLALVACDSVPRPTEPDNAGVAAAAGGLASSHTSAYSSGSPGVIAYDEILPASAYANWQTSVCTATPLVGLNANWVNPHPAFQFADGTHPWWNLMGFSATWINAWSNIGSRGPGGHNWTRYDLTVSGTGQHVIQLLADNCSWIYLDNNIVGVQYENWGQTSTGRFPVELNGTHRLTFIIFDGGGAAGGKFRLETRQSWIDHGGNPALLPPPIQTDATPPVIVPTVTGTQGNNGWYTSNVGVSWSVTDAESAISTSTGCSASTLSIDSNSETYTCSATSAGGSNSASVTVKRDATAPVILFGPSAATYTVDQNVTTYCTGSDATSELASLTCPSVPGAAYTYAVGTTTFSASAVDNAGNSATASIAITVQVTSGSLCALVNQWVSQKGVANSMCQQLKNGAYGAFRNHVSAQSGKTVTPANAAILIALSQSL